MNDVFQTTRSDIINEVSKKLCSTVADNEQQWWKKEDFIVDIQVLCLALTERRSSSQVFSCLNEICEHAEAVESLVGTPSFISAVPDAYLKRQKKYFDHSPTTQGADANDVGIVDFNDMFTNISGDQSDINREENSSMPLQPYALRKNVGQTINIVEYILLSFFIFVDLPEMPPSARLQGLGLISTILAHHMEISVKLLGSDLLKEIIAQLMKESEPANLQLGLDIIYSLLSTHPEILEDGHPIPRAPPLPSASRCIPDPIDKDLLAKDDSSIDKTKPCNEDEEDGDQSDSKNQNYAVLLGDWLSSYLPLALPDDAMTKDKANSESTDEQLWQSYHRTWTVHPKLCVIFINAILDSLVMVEESDGPSYLQQLIKSLLFAIFHLDKVQTGEYLIVPLFELYKLLTWREAAPEMRGLISLSLACAFKRCSGTCATVVNALSANILSLFEVTAGSPPKAIAILKPTHPAVLTLESFFKALYESSMEHWEFAASAWVREFLLKNIQSSTTSSLMKEHWLNNVLSWVQAGLRLELCGSPERTKPSEAWSVLLDLEAATDSGDNRLRTLIDAIFLRSNFQVENLVLSNDFLALGYIAKFSPEKIASLENHPDLIPLLPLSVSLRLEIDAIIDIIRKLQELQNTCLNQKNIVTADAYDAAIASSLSLNWNCLGRMQYGNLLSRLSAWLEDLLDIVTSALESTEETHKLEQVVRLLTSPELRGCCDKVLEREIPTVLSAIEDNPKAATLELLLTTGTEIDMVHLDSQANCKILADRFLSGKQKIALGSATEHNKRKTSVRWALTSDETILATQWQHYDSLALIFALSLRMSQKEQDNCFDQPEGSLAILSFLSRDACLEYLWEDAHENQVADDFYAFFESNMPTAYMWTSPQQRDPSVVVSTRFVLPSFADGGMASGDDRIMEYSHNVKQHAGTVFFARKNSGGKSSLQEEGSIEASLLHGTVCAMAIRAADEGILAHPHPQITRVEEAVKRLAGAQATNKQLSWREACLSEVLLITVARLIRTPGSCAPDKGATPLIIRLLDLLLLCLDLTRIDSTRLSVLISIHNIGAAMVQGPLETLTESRLSRGISSVQHNVLLRRALFDQEEVLRGVAEKIGAVCRNSPKRAVRQVAACVRDSLSSYVTVLARKRSLQFLH